MIRNYLKVIFRSLGRMPSGSIINIFGMSVGIAISLLIMLYVKSEVTVNRGFKEYDNIYRISLGDGTGWQGTPARLGEILTGNLPEIRSFVRIDDAGSNHVIKVAGVPMRAGRVIYADSNFFRIFSLPFKYGEPAGCLSEKFNLVITESVSERLFKDENPVGRSVMFDGKFNARITGVIVDPGQETHINGNTFISFHSMPEVRNQPDIYDCYTCYNYETFLLLDGSADPSPTIVKINAFLDEYGTFDRKPCR
jgi:putative ABC transport system permease protein